jgi:hypothetical protein
VGKANLLTNASKPCREAKPGTKEEKEWLNTTKK